ncbi:aspartate/glutamate racemase family protein [Pantoea coffeiphila]|uniref:maleate cis-trans isomerase family protein n=1 Tax=Pantoea coffeiphila TaxID=1465635 RepID=UPI0019600DB4|nr:aspartate/glutamate racemase family protein [Pantoea coffeiphila]MBM7344472.1 maleate isomerase [Pantoea coffeiphila]
MKIMNQWQTFTAQSDDGPARHAAIGLIVLDSDVVIEQEVRRFLPADGVGLFASRISMAPTLSPETLGALRDEIPAVVARLVPNDRLDVVAFGCTSASMVLGSAALEQIIRAARPQVAVTDPIRAALAAVSTLGINRLAVLTPYEPALNQLFDDFWPANGGAAVVARGCFSKNSDPQICRVAPQAIWQAALQLVRQSGADGLFISCTAMRCSDIITRLEADLGIPVITSNQALAWHAMQLADCHHNSIHYGKIFSY